MSCHWLKLEDGTVVHVRMANARKKKCPFCTRDFATKLCDFVKATSPSGDTFTCDAPICEKCATVVGNNLDYCPDHAPVKARAA